MTALEQHNLHALPLNSPEASHLKANPLSARIITHTIAHVTMTLGSCGLSYATWRTTGSPSGVCTEWFALDFIARLWTNICMTVVQFELDAATAQSAVRHLRDAVPGPARARW